MRIEEEVRELVLSGVEDFVVRWVDVELFWKLVCSVDLSKERTRMRM